LHTWLYVDNGYVSKVVSVQVQMLENNVTINAIYLRNNVIFDVLQCSLYKRNA
jgi:hypothetical protein